MRGTTLRRRCRYSRPTFPHILGLPGHKAADRGVQNILPQRGDRDAVLTPLMSRRAAGICRTYGSSSTIQRRAGPSRVPISPRPDFTTVLCRPKASCYGRCGLSLVIRNHKFPVSSPFQFVSEPGILHEDFAHVEYLVLCYDSACGRQLHLICDGHFVGYSLLSLRLRREDSISSAIPVIS